MVRFMADLIPCPLRLYVMTFAIMRGVPQAGVAFAVTMMLGGWPLRSPSFVDAITRLFNVWGDLS
ncbi:hypothetical protein MesoLj113b_69370 (plasmid) [Mesorhizobium sp. 113-3-3]|nr:hypothetical protein MesoLj113b_69370 [Mesorhizobium sp. 113-3-3]